MSYQAIRTYKRPILVTANPCGSRRSGLGAGVEDIIQQEADCPQQVSTAERDRLREQLAWAKGYYGQRPYGQHWHEGHPDVKAWLEDLMPRISGLYDRPKLLRCSAEARKRASEWTGTLRWVLSQIKSDGREGGYTVIPAGGLTVRTYRLRDYFFRPISAGTPDAAKPPAVPSATESVPFDPSVGGAGGDPTKSGENRVTAIEQAAIDAGIIAGPGEIPAGTTGGGARNGSSPAPGVDYFGGGGAAAGGALGLPATVAGVPTSLILLGGGALFLMRMLK